MSIQLEDGNVVTVVTLYIQYEKSNEFWGVYKNKIDAVNSIKAFMESENRESDEKDEEENREIWELIENGDDYQIWQEKTFGLQKEFTFQRWGL